MRCKIVVMAAVSAAAFAAPVVGWAQTTTSPTTATTAAPSRARIADTMKRATRFMVEKVAHRGGYVWSYLPDRSRIWGEIEAYSTMVWVQPPGTATMGHVFLDAFHATGDAYYYQAAAKVADALIAGQLPAGGWHYFIDFGGPESTARWYATIGKNAWRMEEFQHHWGNATFDDAGTSEAMQFLLRMYVEKREAKYKAPLDKALNFVLKSQMDNGGWPQRYPPVEDGGLHGQPDYTRLITFNDDVAAENVRFLTLYDQAIGDPRIAPAIRHAGDIFVATQQPAPQAGWGLQHTADMKPAGARTYEPKALVTHATAANIGQLMNFYRLTGDAKYLKGIPAALDWLESVRLPRDRWVGGRQFPTFVEIGTNRALYVHRRGSNVVNGEYYVDYDPAHTIGHYNARRSIDTAKLRAEYEALRKLPPAVATRGSPLKAGRKPLDRFWLAGVEAGSDHNSVTGDKSRAGLVSALNAEGWWPTRLNATSHPYTRDGSTTVTPGDFRSTDVGDETDTSPFDVENGPIGISTGTYIDNMTKLIAALRRPR